MRKTSSTCKFDTPVIKHVFSEFMTLPVNLDLKLTISYQDMNDLVYRMAEDGIGTWGQVIDAKVYRPPGKRLGQCMRKSKKYYDFPLTVLDTISGEAYIIDKEILLYGIKAAWIDFPTVLDTSCGYDLKLKKLNAADIDEIVQLAIFGEIRYDLAE